MGFPHGKYTKINPNKPKAIGFCPVCGFPWRRLDIKKQNRMIGGKLIWAGEWACPECYDKPNYDNTPTILGDPKPIPYPLPGDKPDNNSGDQ
jgi:hypothetical protein